MPKNNNNNNNSNNKTKVNKNINKKSKPITNKHKPNTQTIANAIKNKKTTALQCSSWNCNSIRKKIPQIFSFLEINKPDILALQEINCLTEEFNEIKFLLKTKYGYNSYFKCRETRSGGGVALIINENIDSSEYTNVPSNIEAVCATIKGLNNEKTAIISYYNAPSSTKYPTRLTTEFIDNIKNNHKECLILGDLNAHLEPFARKNNANGEILENYIVNSEFSIINNIRTPTSYRLNSKEEDNVLDYIIGTSTFSANLKKFEVDLKSTLIATEKTYFHVPITATFNIILDKRLPYKSNHKPYNYIKADWKLFQENLTNQTTLGIDDLDALAKDITTKLFDAIEISIPKINIDNNYKEKLPQDTVILINTKNKAMRKFYKKRSLENKDTYYSLRICVSIEIEKFRNEKIMQFIEALGPSLEKTINF
jgi:hypothetical protein